MNLSNLATEWLFASIVVLISLLINVIQWLLSLVHKRRIALLEQRVLANRFVRERLINELKNAKTENNNRTIEGETQKTAPTISKKIPSQKETKKRPKFIKGTLQQLFKILKG